MSEGPAPRLGSGVGLRFKAVGLVPRKEQPGPEFQLGFAACLHVPAVPQWVGGQAGRWWPRAPRGDPSACASPSPAAADGA